MTNPKPPKLRLAVIGCGAVATIHHLPAIAASERVEAVVLVDADAGRAKALASRFGVAETATDYRAVVGRVDGAVIALPNNLHAPVAVDLLRQGVPVLVEKPMAVNGREADEMIAASEASGAVLAVGLDFRFFDASVFVRDLLRDGLIGPVRRFDLRQGVITRWPFASNFILKKETAGGGVLADFGVHVLDLLLWWLGDWTEVEYWDDAQGGLESDCDLRLTMRSGAIGTVEISRTRNLRNSCIFEGERATLEAGVWDSDPLIRLSIAGSEISLAGHARKPGGDGLEFRQAFIRQIDDFASAITEKREPFVPGREGRRSLDLIDACYAKRRFLELPWSVLPIPREKVS
ncbi:MAG TPA: Gfo/Idh/MocA family oxidoreductase [Thermoanaerobaculia bacterium]|nr:Gfo/Idh/MocA family oxidoreductase [Thermoanaerobaculia bacterium]